MSVDVLATAHVRPVALAQRVKRGIVGTFAAIGVTALAYIAGAAVGDFSAFDQTSGGYEAPYEGWTGVPIDWSIVDISPTGFVRRGRVLDVLVDCTSGTIAMDLVGLHIPFRGFSERALVVHKPREACISAGFQPAF